MLYFHVESRQKLIFGEHAKFLHVDDRPRLATTLKTGNDVLTIMLDYEEEDLEMILRIMYGYTRG